MQALPFENLAQFVALGFTLVSGWLFGLASSSGGRKWRARYEEEAVEHAGYRDQAETDLRALNKRIQELESELRSGSAAAPVSAAAAVAAVAAAPVIAAEVAAEQHHESVAQVAAYVPDAHHPAPIEAAIAHGHEAEHADPSAEVDAHPSEPHHEHH